jgi:hypothetical protein
MADSEKWLEIQADLKKAVRALKEAREAYEAANPKMDAAGAKFVAVVKEQEKQVSEAANTPPGTFPAITG